MTHVARRSNCNRAAIQFNVTLLSARSRMAIDNPWGRATQGLSEKAPGRGTGPATASQYAGML